MEAFAKAYGFAFLCHARGHSDRTAGEERSFLTVETNFLPGRSVQNLEDLNRQALEWSTVRMEQRPQGKAGLVPAQAFEHERHFLRALTPHLPAPYLLLERDVDEYGSVAVEAIHKGHNGRYVLFAELIATLLRSVADHSETQVIQKYLAYDLLLIDEIGYAEVEPLQIGLFFTLMQKRHRRKSTLITSNLGFAEWGSFLKNDRLTAALIDRLTEASHVFNMKQCVSLRTKLAADT